MTAPLTLPIEYDPTAMAQILGAAQNEITAVSAVRIETDAARDALALELRDVLRVQDDVEARMKRATDPIQTALKEIRSWFRPALGALETLSGALRGELNRYETFKRDQQRTQFAAAQAAAASGDMPAATTALVAASSAAPTKADGIGVVESWVVVSIDPATLPREWMIPDERRIAAHARAAGKAVPAPIAGVIFERVARARVAR